MKKKLSIDDLAIAETEYGCRYLNNQISYYEYEMVNNELVKLSVIDIDVFGK